MTYLSNAHSYGWLPQVRLVVTLLLSLVSIPAMSNANQHVVTLALECSATANGKAGPFNNTIYGLIAPNDLSLVTHWSGHMRSDASDIYYHSFEGQIDTAEKVARIKGMMHWAKRPNKDNWLFERRRVSGFRDALLDAGMPGSLGKGEWRRECVIKSVDQKMLQSIGNTNAVNSSVLAERIKQLEASLAEANTRISDLESQLKTASPKNSTPTQTSNKPIGKLVDLSAQNAVCNDQTRAKVSVFRTGTDKWAVFFPGGGSAGSADEYLKRAQKKNLVSAPRSPRNAGAIGEHLIQLGYNLVVLPYCSSDLYQGDHLQIIGGKEVPFRGRAIVESMVNQFKADFSRATDLVLVGSSAGSVGIGFNIDQFAKFKSTRLILDSFWFDKATLSWYTKDYPRVRPGRVKFQFKNLPTHCDGKFSNCWISRSLLNKHGIESAFIVWNDGDAFQGGVKDKAKLRSAILSDLQHFKAGFSVKAEKANFADNGKGHGMVNKAKAYTQRFEGYSVRSLVNNWLIGNGETIFVDH